MDLAGIFTRSLCVFVLVALVSFGWTILSNFFRKFLLFTLTLLVLVNVIHLKSLLLILSAHSLTYRLKKQKNKRAIRLTFDSILFDVYKIQEKTNSQIKRIKLASYMILKKLDTSYSN